MLSIYVPLFMRHIVAVLASVHLFVCQFCPLVSTQDCIYAFYN